MEEYETELEKGSGSLEEEVLSGIGISPLQKNRKKKTTPKTLIVFMESTVEHRGKRERAVGGSDCTRLRTGRSNSPSERGQRSFSVWMGGGTGGPGTRQGGRGGGVLHQLEYSTSSQLREEMRVMYSEENKQKPALSHTRENHTTRCTLIGHTGVPSYSFACSFNHSFLFIHSFIQQSNHSFIPSH